MAAPSHSRILILDFGSQVHAAHRAPPARDARLLRDPSVRRRRRVRPRVRAEGHHPVGQPRERARRRRPAARPTAVWTLGVPVLGICYGMQTMALQLGGDGRARRRARVRLRRGARARALGAVPRPAGPRQRRRPRPARRLDEPRRQGHARCRAGFKLIGSSASCAIAAMADESRRFYALQFHPEVTHTKQGAAILARFAHDICGCGDDWNMHDYVAEAVASVRAQVGGERRDPRAVRRRRLVGRRGADPPRDRRPAHLRVRRPRPAAPERGGAGDGHVRHAPRRAR